MASVFELANLSAMAYDASNNIYKNWVRRGFHGNPTGQGFFSEFYLNVKKKEVVLAIRGTDGGDKDLSDFGSDLQIGLGQTPEQFKRSLKAYNEVKTVAKRYLGYNYNLYLTGHSLGGGLASLLSAKKAGLPTVTFNAPGMHRSYISSHFINLIGHYNLSFVDVSQFLHIRATGDPVSIATGKHMGKVEEVYVDKWGDGKILGASRHVAQHSMDNMLESLKSKYWYHKDLGWESRS